MKAIRSHCFRVCHCLHRCDDLLLRGLNPEGTRDLVYNCTLEAKRGDSCGGKITIGTSTHAAYRTYSRAGNLPSPTWLPPSSETIKIHPLCSEFVLWGGLFNGTPGTDGGFLQVAGKRICHSRVYTLMFRRGVRSNARICSCLGTCEV